MPLVSAALGHADVRTTTRHYVKLHVSDASAAVASVPPIVPKVATTSSAETRAVFGDARLPREVGSNLAMGERGRANDAETKTRKLDFRPSLRESG